MSFEEIKAQYEPMFDSFTIDKIKVYSGHPVISGRPASNEGLSAEQITECNEVSRVDLNNWKSPHGTQEKIKIIILKKKDGYRIYSVKRYFKARDRWENGLL